MNPYFYSVPSTPYVASAVTQQEEVSISTVLDAYDYLSAKHDIMIVEGIGGLMVPLTETETFADFAKTLNLPSLSLLGVVLVHSTTYFLRLMHQKLMV